MAVYERIGYYCQQLGLDYHTEEKNIHFLLLVKNENMFRVIEIKTIQEMSGMKAIFANLSERVESHGLASRTRWSILGERMGLI